MNGEVAVPITQATMEDTPKSRVISVGQHSNQLLNGVGRKIKIWANGGCMIWEGQFKDGKLTGFGRRLRIFLHHGGVECFIGFWKDDQMQGYGKKIPFSGEFQEGLYVEDELLQGSPSSIKAYDADKD